MSSSQNAPPQQLRSFESALPQDLLDTVQAGMFRTMYRGTFFLKSPFDIGIYLQLLSKLRPRSVIEIGCKHGGSALWFADMMSAHGVENPQVVAIDIAPAMKFTDPRIVVHQGDAKALGAVLSVEALRGLPHPWLVVEDSSHRYPESIAVLRFFDEWLRSGDYLVVEDGVVSHFKDDRYAAFEDGPNRAVRDFLTERPGRYEIDLELCDHYGRNVSYNPNGWLRRL